MFIRVQASERVGGIFDHYSWDPDNVARDNPIKFLKKYKYKFQDDSEDIATRRFFGGEKLIQNSHWLENTTQYKLCIIVTSCDLILCLKIHILFLYWLVHL